MGLHVLAGSVALNTLSGGGKLCTVVFAVIMVASMLVLSLPRGMFGPLSKACIVPDMPLVTELNQVAMLGFFAAISMLIALILCLACKFVRMKGASSHANKRVYRQSSALKMHQRDLCLRCQSRSELGQPRVQPSFKASMPS